MFLLESGWGLFCEVLLSRFPNESPCDGFESQSMVGTDSEWCRRPSTDANKIYDALCSVPFIHMSNMGRKEPRVHGLLWACWLKTFGNLPLTNHILCEGSQARQC